MTRPSTIALLALLATPAHAKIDPTETPVTVIWRDDGGVVGDYARAVMAAQHSGQRVEIAGECASACTMWLAAACVRPNARLGFHGPSSAVYGIGMPPEEHDRIAREMARFYPPAIALWFLSGPANQALGMTYISGQEAIKMGAKVCE